MVERQTYEQAVAEIEQRIGWTVGDGEGCGCNSHPKGPCDRCWSPGWAIGGIDKTEVA